MNLKELRAKFSTKTGCSDIKQANQYLNDAAEEIYIKNDLPGCLREISAKVVSDGLISLPESVGEIRAVRNVFDKITLTDMRPGYQSYPEKWYWNNWRYVGRLPIKYGITSALPLEYSASIYDEGGEVSVAGTAVDSSSATETVELDSPTVYGTVAFATISRISKSKTNSVDITIAQQGSEVISVIRADYLEPGYITLDVSQYPYYDGTNCDFMVLYKMPFVPLSSDSSIFQLPGYDQAIYYQATALWYSDQKDGMSNASAFEAKSVEFVNLVIANQSESQEKFMSFGRNCLKTIFRPRAYAWQCLTSNETR